MRLQTMILVTKTNVNVGDHVSCKYPMRGTRNILTNRKGIVEKAGTGAQGPYVQLRLDSGEFRTLSLKRAVDLVIS